MSYLYETIKQRAYEERLIYPEVPQYVLSNLKHEPFEWQREALENLLTFEALKEKLGDKTPVHLMFNHATGAGKTMLMASALLYYYKKGYRHFIFFVNQNNIVDKTEKNFTEKSHSKYLFTENIVIDDEVINIKKVKIFSETTSDIEIKFTTIQQLYNDIHIEKENQIFLDDLLKRDIVMLADEAHHLNTDTKRKDLDTKEMDLVTELTERAGDVEVERKGWEHTVVQLLLNKNGAKGVNKNILLEFTATVPEGGAVQEKYEDKIIHKFGLKEFLAVGYTKEINLISSSLAKKERILHALLFNWYRHKIALDNGISNFKPVVLFRSKTIEESRTDYTDFIQMAKTLKATDFNFLKTIEAKIAKDDGLYEQGQSRTWDVIEYIKRKKIKYSEIADFIKYNFQENLNVLITNSKDNKTKTKEKTTSEQEDLLNNLEDKNNHIRAIFTVDRLTEGWDVLNLYDIVRLYQGVNSGGSNKTTAPSTVKEKQLIGRGVRYFPFTYKDIPKNKRKFDEDLKHELRVLEELYYYTHDEKSRYISELKNELRKDGFIRDDKTVKTFSLKPAFKKSDFYKTAKIFKNDYAENPKRRKKNLDEIKSALKCMYRITDLEIREEEVVLEKGQKDKERLEIKNAKTHTINKKVNDFERHIVMKAIHKTSIPTTSLLRFERLSPELNISSIDDLFTNDFLGNIEISIVLEKEKKFEDLTNQQQLDILLVFFKNFLTVLKEEVNLYIGTEFVPVAFKDIFGGEKTKSVKEDEESKNIAKELQSQDWYVTSDFHGTSEEKALLQFVKDTIGNLEKKYKKVYLLRNEEVFKIYDFKKGRGFQPDFLLFLEGKKNAFYQIFIEPKGDNLLEKDEWKGDFLKDITERYGEKNVIRREGKDYRLIGLPLFNEKQKEVFEEKYNLLIS